jgi:hypothetical protein
MDTKNKTIAFGVTFALLLILAYFESRLFLENIRSFFVSPVLTVAMFFTNNVIAVSLIIVGMSFYVMVVKTFLPKRGFEYVVLNHPRLFAMVFTGIILVSSVVRVGVIMGGRAMDMITTTMAIFLPHGILEAYGIYTTVHRTLTERLTGRVLVLIYFIFFMAVILEVGFVVALVFFAS